VWSYSIRPTHSGPRRSHRARLTGHTLHGDASQHAPNISSATRRLGPPTRTLILLARSVGLDASSSCRCPVGPSLHAKPPPITRACQRLTPTSEQLLRVVRAHPGRVPVDLALHYYWFFVFSTVAAPVSGFIGECIPRLSLSRHPARHHGGGTATTRRSGYRSHRRLQQAATKRIGELQKLNVGGVAVSKLSLKTILGLCHGLLPCCHRDCTSSMRSPVAL
jgi:hypothetical protein